MMGSWSRKKQMLLIPTASFLDRLSYLLLERLEGTKTNRCYFQHQLFEILRKHALLFIKQGCHISFDPTR